VQKCGRDKNRGRIRGGEEGGLDGEHGEAEGERQAQQQHHRRPPLRRRQRRPRHWRRAAVDGEEKSVGSVPERERQGTRRFLDKTITSVGHL
jgi:hypothetical protein